MLIQSNTVLRKVGVRSSEPDSVNLRARFERTLAAIDLRPSSLPPSAILCVREVRDRSGRLRLRTEPDFAAIQRWRQTIVSMFDELARSAARPARALIPASPEAVIFADEAELLACLALDWRAGTALGCWWWKTLFPTLDVTEAIQKAWTENPQHVPTALCRLAQAGHSADFLRALPHSAAAEMLENVLGSFDLLQLRPAMTSARASAPDSRIALAPATRTSASAPWSRWADIDPGLAFEQRHLLVISLMLERAPGVLRSAGFARALREWNEAPGSAGEAAVPASGGLPPSSKNLRTRALRAADLAANSPAPTQSDAKRSVFRKTSPAPLATGAHLAKDSVSDFAGPDEAGSGDSVLLPCSVTPTSAVLQRPKFEPSVLSHEVLAEPPPEVVERDCSPAGPPAEVVDTDRSTAELPAEVNGTHHSIPELRVGVVDTDRSLPEALAEVVDTDWGGVFYLVNVALALGLYGDFTMPLQPGLALPVWDFLALVGRRLIGSELEADPVWGLLAKLAGRDEREQPGQWFEPPSEWRIPAVWLAPFARRTDFPWSAALGCVRVLHPMGFLVLDVSLEFEQPMQRVADELQRLGVKAAETAAPESFPSIAAMPLERWLDWLVPYIEARLKRALDVANGHALRDLVFRHQGRIENTANRVDVRFQLAEHPIELRLAGLDRDPGWVPAAGRNLLFFYD